MHTDGVRTRTGNLLGAVALGVGDRVLRAAEEAAGRSGARAAALATLAQWPSDTIEQLRTCLGLSHSATVRLVDGLVADGLVRREQVGGGPAVRPRLTEAGRAEARRILAGRNSVLQSLVGVLSDTEVAALTGVLEQLLESMTSDFEAGELICRLCELDACPQDICPVDVRQQYFKQLAEASRRPI
jgi:MarR family transcriptional regulator, negative regulator of the multidrug operon emrRAB